MKASQSTLVERRMKFMPCTVEPSASVAYARALLGERGINHLPVISSGRLVGIISSRDLQPDLLSAKRPALHKALETRPNRVRIGSVMTAKVHTVEPVHTLRRAAELMSRERVGALPVVEGGRLVGIISRSDLVDVFPTFSPRQSKCDSSRYGGGAGSSLSTAGALSHMRRRPRRFMNCGERE